MPHSPETLTRRQWLARSTVGIGLVACAQVTYGQATRKSAGKAARAPTPPPTRSPLAPVDIARLPPGLERLDLFLLIGQSNMKGRDHMPDEPSRDPRLVMMHLRDDAWYIARHPVHLVGDARTFKGADNAGVGPGLAFATAVAGRNPNARVGLIPCAVGGSAIALWQKGARLYDESLKGHIGDNVHFDTAAQEEIGRRFAESYFALVR